MKRILSLGAGVQSTTLLLMSLRGELPRLDAAIFADTQWEPSDVYEHLEWLKDECQKENLPLYCLTAGDLRQDALDFRKMRRSADGTSSTGKRYASIPAYVRNPDGSKGRVKRQCTNEYKIKVVEKCIRQTILGLKPKERAPVFPVIEHWFGISSDESQRATFPGLFVKKKIGLQGMLFGAHLEIKAKKWIPTRWEVNAYPLLDAALYSNRKSKSLGYLPRTMTRHDCREWLQKHYPERTVPRSACIGCPFHSNAEWKRMRDERPEDWADAVRFDYEHRNADIDNADRSGMIVGELYIHRQLVPLDMVNLDGDGEHDGTHCGMLNDGMDGMCGV